jgi:hypothetical protein
VAGYARGAGGRHSSAAGRVGCSANAHHPASTEAAADFLLDDYRLDAFLEKLSPNRKAGPPPYFELVLTTTNIGGTASTPEILTWRLRADRYP